MVDCIFCGTVFEPTKSERVTLISGGSTELRDVKCPSCNNIGLYIFTGGKFRSPVDSSLSLSKDLIPSADDEIKELKEQIDNLNKTLQSPDKLSVVLEKFYHDDGVIVERLPAARFKKQFKNLLTKDLTTELFGSTIKTALNEEFKLKSIDDELKKLNKEKKSLESYVGLQKLLLNDDGSIKGFTGIMNDYSLKLFNLLSNTVMKKQRVTLVNGLLGIGSIIHTFPEPSLIEVYENYEKLIDLLSVNESIKGLVVNRFNLINEAIDIYDDEFYNKKTAELIKRTKLEIERKGDEFSLNEAFKLIAWKGWVESEDSLITVYLDNLLSDIKVKTKDYDELLLKIESLENQRSKDVFDSDYYKVQARCLTDSKLCGYRPPKDERFSFIERIFKDVPEPRRSLFDVKGTNLVSVLINNTQGPGDLTELSRDLLNATANKLVNNDCGEGLVITVYGKENEINYLKDSFLNYLSKIRSSADSLASGFKRFFEGEQDYDSIESLINENIIHLMNLRINSWDKLLNFFRTYEFIDEKLGENKVNNLKPASDYFKNFGKKSWVGSELEPLHQVSIADRLDTVKKSFRKAYNCLSNLFKKKEDKPDDIKELLITEPSCDDSIYFKLLRREDENLKLESFLKGVEYGVLGKKNLNETITQSKTGLLERLEPVKNFFEDGWDAFLKAFNIRKDESAPKYKVLSFDGLTPLLFNNMVRNIPVEERVNKQSNFLKNFYVDKDNFKQWFAASTITTGIGCALPPVLIIGAGMFAYTIGSKHFNDRTLPEVIDYDSCLKLLSELSLKNKPIYFLPHLYKEQSFDLAEGN